MIVRNMQYYEGHLMVGDDMFQKHAILLFRELLKRCSIGETGESRYENLQYRLERTSQGPKSPPTYVLQLLNIRPGVQYVWADHIVPPQGIRCIFMRVPVGEAIANLEECLKHSPCEYLSDFEDSSHDLMLGDILQAAHDAYLDYQVKAVDGSLLPNSDIKWDGPEFPAGVLPHGTPQPREYLTLDRLTLGLNKTGNTPMKTLFRIAIQFGICQGMRQQARDKAVAKSVRDPFE
jgi:hypothetical protein